MQLINRIKLLTGIEQTTISHREKWISGIGSFLGIGILYWITSLQLEQAHATLIAFSMGASAVLLFAVPHSPLSQPWPLFAGNLLSALVGVGCALMIPSPLIAAATAVAAAIVCMHYLGCLHPPGGATALIAVLGGEPIHQLGWHFIFSPILINVVILFCVAVAFNYFFPWRRYPSVLSRSGAVNKATSTTREHIQIESADIQYALSHMNSFIDINENDISRLFQLALEHQQQQRLESNQLSIGAYYSNGRTGDGWSVRHIVDLAPPRGNKSGIVVFRVVAGHEKRDSGYCSVDDFVNWARYEVVKQDDKWARYESVKKL